MFPTYAERELADGRYITIIPLTYGRARICIQSNKENLWYTDNW